MAAIPLHSCNNSFHQPRNSSEAIATGAEERYHLLDVVNRGVYGVVYRAWDNTTGKIVAVKHEFDGLSQSTQREIEILACLPPHPCIVDFKEAIVDGYGRVLVVMEYLPIDLKKLMDARTKLPFTVSEVKLMMKQILEGIQFLHDKGVMHRDLKPANILINSKAHLKICDFGLSRAMDSASGSYTPGVVSQWYRAPELLFGARNYSSAIDMWSVGCIMAELVLRQVLLPGNSELHQLDCIFHTLHKGAASSNMQLRRRLAAAARFGRATVLTDSGIHLLERLLELEPEKRITAKDALHHPWFREFYGLHLD